MKRFWLVLLLLAFAISPAHAAVDPDAFSANSYPVAGLGETGYKGTFEWDETPWVYTVFTGVGDGTPDAQTEFFFNFNHAEFVTKSFASDAPGVLELWSSPTDWLDVRLAGFWETHTFETVFPGETSPFNVDDSWSSFTVNAPTVTPEPASMLLFGLGAGALGLTRLRKKKS